MKKGIIEKYREFLPVTSHTPVITLKEGDTPLIPGKVLSDITNAKVFLKFEGAHPTGSFKDRGMTMAISKALEEGAKAVICASTGNTSASAAAYAAKGGLRCVVIIPEGKIAMGKLSQALMHGAQVLALRGNFDDALKMVVEITSKYPIKLVNSLNPYRIEGQKTGAFEVCDQLGRAPDYHFIPVGNAGNITAYWKGYREYFQAGRINSLPKMMGYQAEGAAPIVRGKVIEHPETIATAIRIGNPARWREAEEASRQSGGRIDMVSDEEILHAYHLLAKEEGIFVEPASAASVAGLLKFSKGNPQLLKGKWVVCILTGTGLKDPELAVKESPPPLTVSKDLGRIVEEIGLEK